MVKCKTNRYGFGRAVTSKVTRLGRECTNCGKWKSWLEFRKDSSSKTLHTARCRECLLKKESEKSRADYYKKKGKEYYEKNKEKHKLDKIYYKDPIIKQNRSIRGKIKPTEARVNKMFYFINKGYNLEYLKKIYNFESFCKYTS